MKGFLMECLVATTILTLTKDLSTGTYVKNTLVQQTTAEYLEQQLGWE